MSIAYREHHATLGSTNDRAMTLAARAGVPLPALVTATEQSRGRGRRGKSWVAKRGDVIGTVLLEVDVARAPDDGPDAEGRDTEGRDAGPRTAHDAYAGGRVLTRAPVAAGLSVIGSLATARPELDARLRLKWPNDVWLDGRKLGGLLIESRLVGTGLRLAVGFGVNVGAAPDGAAALPDGGNDLAATIAADLVPNVAAWASTGIPRDLLARRDGLAGRRVTIDLYGTPVTGRAAGLTADGGLGLEHADGPVELYDGSVVSVED